MIKVNQNGDISKEIIKIKVLHNGEYKDVKKIYDINGKMIFRNYSENLLPLENQSFTLKGVTFTVRNGYIYFTGKPANEVLISDNPIFIQNFGFELSAGTYDFITKPNSIIMHAIVTKNNGDGTYTALANNGKSARTVQFVIDEDNTPVFLKFYYYKATIIPDTPIKYIVCRSV